MKLEQFFTKGSGTGGQGPGRVGSMILDKAGVMIELPAGHEMVSVLRGFSGVHYVGSRMVADKEAITEPELSPEDKRRVALDDMRAKLEAKDSPMAVIRRVAKEPAVSRAKKVDMIDTIMAALERDDPEVVGLMKAAFDREPVAEASADA